MLKPVTQRTAIVTGGSRGIGAATARLLGAQGYHVAVNFTADEAAALAVVADVAQCGVKSIAIQGDVSNEQDVLRLFETAARELGPVGALVNNAGIVGGISRLVDVDASNLTRMLAINVTGSILCAREAVKCMSRNRGGGGGAIVNVSSLAARTGGSGEWVHYAASKGAIDSLTIGLAREVADEGIRVNAVAPGLIETTIHAAAGAPDRLTRLAPSVPMRRAGTPDEVAAAILWLLSDAASYVTGSILEIGGGR